MKTMDSEIRHCVLMPKAFGFIIFQQICKLSCTKRFRLNIYAPCCRPGSPIRFRESGIDELLYRALANWSGLSDSTSSPVMSFSTISRRPPFSRCNTGQPAIAASSAVDQMDYLIGWERHKCRSCHRFQRDPKQIRAILPFHPGSGRSPDFVDIAYALDSIPKIWSSHLIQQ